VPSERQVKEETGKEGEIGARKVDKKRAVTAAAVGAGAGAVAGAVMGGGKGAIIGAAIGAGAGTGAGILTDRNFKLE
jgi:outer membrane lipoprotein SlyB